LMIKNPISDQHLWWRRCAELKSMLNSTHVPMSRCPTGKDWWYMGEGVRREAQPEIPWPLLLLPQPRCFCLMLMVTPVSVCCIRKKSFKKTSSNTANTTMENLSWVCYMVIQNLLMRPYGEELGHFYKLFKKIFFCFLCEDNRLETKSHESIYF
jgi:hypothetical protein